MEQPQLFSKKEADELKAASTIITNAIRDEVVRATLLHGNIRGLHEAYGVIMEEVDEFWDEVKLNPKKMTPEEVIAWKARTRKELIQTAAMCVKTIVHLGL